MKAYITARDGDGKIVGEWETDDNGTHTMKNSDAVLLEARATALGIATTLMRRHLEAATPDGVGRDSAAYQIAQGRIQTLDELRDELLGELLIDRVKGDGMGGEQ